MYSFLAIYINFVPTPPCSEDLSQPSTAPSSFQTQDTRATCHYHPMPDHFLGFTVYRNGLLTFWIVSHGMEHHVIIRKYPPHLTLSLKGGHWWCCWRCFSRGHYPEEFLQWYPGAAIIDVVIMSVFLCMKYRFRHQILFLPNGVHQFPFYQTSSMSGWVKCCLWNLAVLCFCTELVVRSRDKCCWQNPNWMLVNRLLVNVQFVKSPTILPMM